MTKSRLRLPLLGYTKDRVKLFQGSSGAFGTAQVLLGQTEQNVPP